MIFRFFESARIAFLERCRFIAAYDELKIGAILHSTDCRFRQPLYHPDTVLVGARATEILDDRFVMEYKVFSNENSQHKHHQRNRPDPIDFRANSFPHVAHRSTGFEISSLENRPLEKPPLTRERPE